MPTPAVPQGEGWSPEKWIPEGSKAELLLWLLTVATVTLLGSSGTQPHPDNS